jgi:uncharacterized CHY-type Zn-finger protein
MLYDAPLLLPTKLLLTLPPGRKWFDCAECHLETEDHPLLQKTEMVTHPLPPPSPRPSQPTQHPSFLLPNTPTNASQTFACKKCKKAFRKDAQEFEESDEYCPHCDNHFVIDAVTPKPMLKFEGEDARVDSRMLKDDRIRGEEQRSIFDVKDAPDKLG